MLKFKRKVNLHNKFHLVLTDSRTGKVKQEAWAYNIILDRGIENLVHWFSERSGIARMITNDSDGFAHSIFIGEGTGTLDVGRTELFDYLDRKQSSLHAYSFTEAYHTRKAIWTEQEFQNQSIREVGIGGNGVALLNTHALIEDSEGNPITVEKGELDVLTVYSTIFVEIEHPHDTSRFDFVTGHHAADPQGHGIVKSIVGNARFGASGSAISYFLFFGKDGSDIDVEDKPVKDLIGVSYYWDGITLTSSNGYISKRADGKAVVFDVRVPADSEYNVSEGIREIGLGVGMNENYGYSTNPIPIFRCALPLPGVWTGKNIEAEEVGTGDDNQTEFELQWGDIVEGSETIYVNEVAQVKDTDYTINYETGIVTFSTAPGDGLSVTADYSVEYIPKDENHVLDIYLELEFADGGEGS